MIASLSQSNRRRGCEAVVAEPVDVSGEEFASEVIECEDAPVLVDFWSPTCPHCQALNPQYEIAAKQHDGLVKFAKVVFPDAKEIFTEHGVRATPTLILFRGGEEIARTVGAKQADELTEWLEKHLEQ